MKIGEVKWRGLGCVFGSFLIQLTIGTFVGTVGNMLPYLSSYMRWRGEEVTIGDTVLIQAVGGIANGLAIMLSGFFIIPYLGMLGCLYLSCGLFITGSFLIYWSLDYSLVSLIITAGFLPGLGNGMVLVPTYLLPTAWFPQHRGMVIGIIQVGFGLSSFVFTPLQTFLINPNNKSPTTNKVAAFDGHPLISNITVRNVTEGVAYFTDDELLEYVPLSCLYLAAIYAAIILVAFTLIVGPPQQGTSDKTDGVRGSSRIKEALKYLVKNVFTNGNYSYLFIVHFLLFVVCAALFGQWKSLSLTVQDDDQLVALIGSIVGVFNCLSRFLGGFLMDHLTFRQVMSSCSFLLACVCFSIVFVARTNNFIGFATCVWASYLFGMAHFAIVPAQVIKLFGAEQSSIVIGSLGLPCVLGFIIYAILSWMFFSSMVSSNSFLWLFVCLGGFALVAALAASFVTEPAERSCSAKDEKDETQIEL